MGLYDIPVTTLDGRVITLEGYRGQVLLIVNVASRCGFTPQYTGLEELSTASTANRASQSSPSPATISAYQEPGNADEIKNFCPA